MSYPLVILGGGLSGLAAGIRFARFGRKVVILEKHSVPGGLNSYYFRRGFLLETGLHAMTNYAPPGERHTPLNQLFRQLKLSRKKFATHEQFSSEIVFPSGMNLIFSNDFKLLKEQVALRFPHAFDRFSKLVQVIDAYDPFALQPWISTRSQLQSILEEPLLADMLLWPLMVYGNCEEHDMDFSQFVIMFRAIFQEGLFRPAGTIKDFLALLLKHYASYGGEIRLKSEANSIEFEKGRVCGVHLASGEFVPCDNLISTIGFSETLKLLPPSEEMQAASFLRGKPLNAYAGMMTFTESIYLLSKEMQSRLPQDRTIIFYCLDDHFDYRCPKQAVDPNYGVICFPSHFQGMSEKDVFQVRITHPANYELWRRAGPEEYRVMKQEWEERSANVVSEIIGNYRKNVVYHDSFTPLTIEKYTGKRQGAVYGSPVKIKDGKTPYENFFIAGTDQGFLGIVGSMLSGVTIVNQHILKQ